MSVGKNISRLRTDIGREYISNDFQRYCKLKGIKMHHHAGMIQLQNCYAKYQHTLFLIEKKIIYMICGPATWVIHYFLIFYFAVHICTVLRNIHITHIANCEFS